MTTEDKIWTATVAFDKGYDFETLKYSDYMYGRENLTDEVWAYVKECKRIGADAFYEKYAEYKLY